jgi:hypothetical protein
MIFAMPDKLWRELSIVLPSNIGVAYLADTQAGLQGAAHVVGSTRDWHDPRPRAGGLVDPHSVGAD